MANWFESVTKTLADDKLSRRKALQKAAGAAAGIALAAFIPAEAFASSDGVCSPAGNCSVGFAACGHNVNNNCFCFSKKNGTGKCGCNIFCSQVQTCANSAGCPAGSFCSFSTSCNCTGATGYCIPKCTKTCILSGAHTGSTAVHH